MIHHPLLRFSPADRWRRAGRLTLAGAMVAAGCLGSAWATNFPITAQQRATAEQVAQAGVPLSELAPNAPDAYTVKRGDTLWAISSIFLRTPWRWPELWGMNTDQIRNPHLIYPGQVLYLDKTGGRARLRLGNAVGNGLPSGTVKVSPRVRSESLLAAAIAAIPVHLIEPFLTEAVIFNSNELDQAPRVVAGQEGRVLMARGNVAYVRGELGNRREWRLFRNPKPLRDPATQEILGYEAPFLGTAEYRRPGGTTPAGEVIPATFEVQAARLEIGAGDRLAPVPERDFIRYVPHAPQGEIDGRIASIYGDGITAGQNQIVALNKGAVDGLERGHVLALWRYGSQATDDTDAQRTAMKLPDERHGLLFVFRVFDRMSYALILNVQQPVQIGDRFTQP